jgi:hypothetical protein
MRISPSPYSWKFIEPLLFSRPWLVGTGMPDMQRCRRCEVPARENYFFETSARCLHLVAMMPSRTSTLGS